NFLELMVEALTDNPDCSIGHCNLELIDENGSKLETRSWDNYAIAKVSGDALRRYHKRLAPFDGLLYPVLGTIYTSLSQIIVKKAVFSRAGLFPTEYGPIGDFEWGMRVALLFNTIHVPEYLATWRQHTRQLTDRSRYTSHEYERQLQRMIESALAKAA